MTTSYFICQEIPSTTQRITSSLYLDKKLTALYLDQFHSLYLYYRDQLGRTTLHLVITSWPSILTTWRKPSSKVQTTVTGVHEHAEACLRLLCEHGVDVNAEVISISHSKSMFSFFLHHLAVIPTLKRFASGVCVLWFLPRWRVIGVRQLFTYQHNMQLCLPFIFWPAMALMLMLWTAVGWRPCIWPLGSSTRTLWPAWSRRERISTWFVLFLFFFFFLLKLSQ